MDEEAIKVAAEREREREEERLRQEEADRRFRKKGTADFGMSSFMGEIELASNARVRGVAESLANVDCDLLCILKSAGIRLNCSILRRR